MAVSGRFEADFASFDTAVQNSIIQLRGFEAGTAKVESALTRMTDNFSGRKIITEATELAEVFKRVGGTSQLTAAELARVSATASEARAKFLALGQDVPPGIQALSEAVHRVGTASGTTVPQVNTLKGALTQFDGLLGSLGVNIGGGVRGLGELGEASGKSASQLGVIATAGLVVGAGIAGWKIGRAVSEFFDLDNIIGNATAKLLGWGDAASEAAGSKADALARASKTIGFEVLNLTTAMEINAVSQAKWRDNATISADTVARWQGEIAKVRASGDLDSLTKDLASQNFSLQELADRYHLTVEAIQFFTREQTNAAKAVTDANAIIDASNKTKLHALQEELAAHKEAAQREAGQIAATAILWDDYYKTVNAASHDTTQAQIDNVWLAADAQIAAMEKAKTLTVAGYDAIWAKATQTATNIIQTQLEGTKGTREYYARLADQAKIAYDFALAHASSFTTQQTRLLHDAYVNAQQDSEHWAQAAAADMDTVADKADQTAAAIDHVAAATRRAMSSTGFSDAAGNEMAAPSGSTVQQIKDFQDSVLTAAVAVGMSVDQITAMFPKFSGTMDQFVALGEAAIAGNRAALARWLALGGTGPSTVVSPGSPGGRPASAPVTVTVNMSGILVGSSPAAKAEVADYVGKVIIDQFYQQGWRPTLGVRR